MSNVQMTPEQAQELILQHLVARELQKARNEANKEKTKKARAARKQTIDQLLASLSPEDLAAYVQLAAEQAAQKLAQKNAQG